MSFWTFILVAIAIFAVVELIQKQSDGARQTKLAKIEADLKRDLVDRLGDPELVARVVEAKLSVQEPGEETKSAVTNGVHVHAAVHAGASTDEEEGGSGILLGGMVCLLVGAAFLVLSAAANEAFIIPGAIVTAVGLALLAYPSARDELTRSRRRRLEKARAEHSQHGGTAA